MQFKVNKSYKENIGKQLEAFEQEGVISPEQHQTMIESYEVVKSVSLIRLISVVGSVLVGLGVLTYIAGNWQEMSPVFRMTLILLGLTGFYSCGMLLSRSYPRTGQALRYISLFIYGGGLFLTDQTYHLNRSITFHFLVWAVGVLVALYFERDTLVLHFYQVLIIVSTMTLIDPYGMTDSTQLTYLFMALVGYGLALRMTEINYKSKMATFLNGVGIFFILIAVMNYMDLDFVIGALVIFALGLVFVLKPPFGKISVMIMNQLGIVITGVSGFVLTFSDTWSDLLNSDGTVISIVFTVAFLLLLFYLVKQGYFAAIGFIALVIMRYYFDTFYDFMPKSLFFIIGGSMLIGFGVYLESIRRKGLDDNA